MTKIENEKFNVIFLILEGKNRWKEIQETLKLQNPTLIKILNELTEKGVIYTKIDEKDRRVSRYYINFTELAKFFNEEFNIGLTQEEIEEFGKWMENNTQKLVDIWKFNDTLSEYTTPQIIAFQLKSASEITKLIRELEKKVKKPAIQWLKEANLKSPVLEEMIRRSDMKGLPEPILEKLSKIKTHPYLDGMIAVLHTVIKWRWLNDKDICCGMGLE